MHLLIRISAALGLLATIPAHAGKVPLLVTYIDKPPYYYQPGAATPPTGFLLNYVVRVLDQAGIAAHYELRPAVRALAEIEHASSPLCSVGWFKTAERERYGNYSAPLYRDPPMMLVTRPESLRKLKPFASAASLVNDPTLQPGTVAGFTYGAYLDGLLRGRSARIDASAQTLQQNLAKVIFGRVDYIFMDQAELHYWSRQPGLQGHPVASLSLPDLPAGNLRYLLCSKQVDDATLQRINRAIASLPKPMPPGQ